MNEVKLEKLRYPIGHFVIPDPITETHRADWLGQLEGFPVRLSDLLGPLTEIQLETPYRPGGWTVRQLVHHIADSHHNCYMRFKWTLTEDNPLIKAYSEKEWAELADSRTAPIALSMAHLKAVHAKLVFLIRSLSNAQLQRQFRHPDSAGLISLEETMGRYAWHGKHHFTHIKNLLLREGWLAE